MKKILLSALLLLCAVAAFAQATGGIKASVVNRDGRVPIPGSQVSLLQGDVKMAEAKTDENGNFMFSSLPDGKYNLVVNVEGYVPTTVNVTVEGGFIRDLMYVGLTQVATQASTQGDENFVEQDLLDTGYSDSPAILFASNDPYTNVVGYGFSAVRFKNRGYNSESQDVYLAGVKMNDALTGYTPYALWSGLNEAMRAKDSVQGLEMSDFGVGGYNGVTCINAMPSAFRPGWRFSVLTNSAMYRLRLMASYASGQLDNGWSYAFNVSGRLGGNDWVEGVFYRQFAIYAGVEKKFCDEHKLGLIFLMAPGERGTQNASTQEVYNLMGDNMYNSNWGYQDGKVRNSRIRKTYEPVIALKYEFKPSDALKVNATLLWRTGVNGYTALDWYDAPDPRPDYYKNLPSYSYFEDEDYNRQNDEKAAWAKEMWNPNISSYANYQHVDWDRMYNVNYNMADGRSKYVQEERHVDQNDINLAANARWDINRHWRLDGGISGKINRTENYKQIADLLGGQYYLNVDQYAERDFGSIEARKQNDLDYWLANGCNAEKITKNGKYGYDYLAQVRKAEIWANGRYFLGGLTVGLSGRIGYEGFWRDGLVRKGLFAGLDDNGQEIIDPQTGIVLTTYDSNGNVITSKGKSEVKNFLTGSAKLSLEYVWTGGHRLAFNGGYFSDAPTFSQSFISARTRNTIMDNLVNRKTWSTDLTYQYSNHGYNVRVTAYYTRMMDQSKVMSFYDDSQHSMTNFAMTGINQRNAGIELGAKIPLPVDGLSLSGVFFFGRSTYYGTPHMVQTMDNSALIIRDEDVPFWSETPIFKKVEEDGQMVYAQDLDGNYIVDHYEKHHGASSPEMAAELAINYRTRNYWFFEINGQYFGNTYLDMNPLYRTKDACRGSETDPGIIEYMTSQEMFDPAFLLNLSAGKSWRIQRKYNLGFSLEVKNILNNTNVRTGGYEQTRLISSAGKDRYYKFDPKYFYMSGVNYMLNIYFNF